MATACYRRGYERLLMEMERTRTAAKDITILAGIDTAALRSSLAKAEAERDEARLALAEWGDWKNGKVIGDEPDSDSLEQLRSWVRAEKARCKAEGTLFDTGFRCVSEGGTLFAFDPETVEQALDDRDAAIAERDRLRLELESAQEGQKCCAPGTEEWARLSSENARLKAGRDGLRGALRGLTYKWRSQAMAAEDVPVIGDESAKALYTCAMEVGAALAATGAEGAEASSESNPAKTEADHG